VTLHVASPSYEARANSASSRSDAVFGGTFGSSGLWSSCSGLSCAWYSIVARLTVTLFPLVEEQAVKESPKRSAANACCAVRSILDVLFNSGHGHGDVAFGFCLGEFSREKRVLFGHDPVVVRFRDLDVGVCFVELPIDECFFGCEGLHCLAAAVGDKADNG